MERERNKRNQNDRINEKKNILKMWGMKGRRENRKTMEIKKILKKVRRMKTSKKYIVAKKEKKRKID